MVDSNDPTTPSPEPLATPKPKSQALPDPKTPATSNVKLPATPSVKTPAAQVLKTPVARTPNTPIVPILSPRGSEAGPSNPLIPATGGLDTSVAASTPAASPAASSAVPDTTAADSTAVDATAADATATPVAAETTNVNQAIPAVRIMLLYISMPKTDLCGRTLNWNGMLTRLSMMTSTCPFPAPPPSTLKITERNRANEMHRQRRFIHRVNQLDYPRVPQAPRTNLSRVWRC